MNSDSRIKNSMRNIVVGLGGQSTTLLLNFISRSVFIKTLSIEYLGVNGLFSNILTMLSLVDLGIGSAIVYSMYEPIAKNDKKKLKGLMNLYSKVYILIGLGMTLIGLCIIPFLDVIIKNKPNINNLTLIYLMFLCNTVVSYFFSYKRSIITADQRDYICSFYRYIFNFIKVFLQIIILYLSKNFILYLLIQIICTIGENLAISYKANKLYPFLKDNKKEKLDGKVKKEIFKNVKALMIYKICGVMLDGTDNIIISSFVGVVWVGLVSNYTLIVGAISTIISQIFGAITASIGNMVSNEIVEKQEEIFNIIFLGSFLLYGISSICLFVLINPFIELWIGYEYKLSMSVVFVLVLNFYIYGMQTTVWTFRSTMGLFVYGKYRPLISSIINIVASIVLAKNYGVLGVLMGTTISRVLTNVFFDPWIIFKYGFKKSIKRYYIKYILYFLLLIATILIISFINTKVIIENSIYILVLKAILMIIFITIGWILIFYKTKELGYIINKLKNIKINIYNR